MTKNKRTSKEKTSQQFIKEVLKLGRKYNFEVDVLNIAFLTGGDIEIMGGADIVFERKNVAVPIIAVNEENIFGGDDGCETITKGA